MINQEKLNMDFQNELNRLQEMMNLINSNQDLPVDLYHLEGSDKGDNKIDSLTKEPSGTLLTGDEVISTTPERENDEFIKSSVDDLVPIPRESEVTSVCDDLECNMPITTHLPTTDVREEKLDIDLPLGEHLDTLLTGDKEVDFNPNRDIEELERLLADDPVPVPRVSDISSLDPPESTPFIDESTLLVIPLPDSKEISLREVERFDPFFFLAQSGGTMRVMETSSLGFHHMSSPHHVVYSPKEVQGIENKAKTDFWPRLEEVYAFFEIKSKSLIFLKHVIGKNTKIRVKRCLYLLLSRSDIIYVDEMQSKIDSMMINLGNPTPEPLVNSCFYEESDDDIKCESYTTINTVLATKGTYKHPKNWDMVISTTPAREYDDFIKSSIDDLVLILRESEVTSNREPVVNFLMENVDVAGLPRHLVKRLFSYLLKSLTKGMSDEPLGDDSKPRSYDVTFSNPLFDFNDDSTLYSIPYNHLRQMTFEELIAEIVLDDSIPIRIDDRYYDSEGDILFFEQLLNEDTSSNASPALLPTESSSLILPLPDPSFDLFLEILSDESKVHIEVLSVLWENRLPIPDDSLPLSR
ncbi:hypothetical protein Tco_0879293 [Tanacetum coccineum]